MKEEFAVYSFVKGEQKKLYIYRKSSNKRPGRLFQI